MNVREIMNCLFCRHEVQVNWFSGELVTRDGNAVCVTVHGVEVMHVRDDGSHAHLDPTAS